jgi:hypothetical protein
VRWVGAETLMRPCVRGRKCSRLILIFARVMAVMTLLLVVRIIAPMICGFNVDSIFSTYYLPITRLCYGLLGC